MKNPARVMALQAEQIPSLSGMPGGGSPEVDQSTAAALSAGMKRRYYLAARLKWALDWSVANELEYMLWVEAAGIAHDEKWRIPTGRSYVRRMAGLAIAEMADPKRWRDAQQKAEWMGVSKSQFSRVWEKRYNAVYEELESWTGRAFGYLIGRQSELHGE